MTGHCLVDYDNLEHRDRELGLAVLARRIAAAVSADKPGLKALSLRLYGGWYDESGLTREGTRLTQVFGSIFPFPVKIDGAWLNIRCEIASTLVDHPADILPFTLRTKRGLKIRPRSVIPPNCTSPTACGVLHVQAWVRGQCPISGCEVPTENAFVYREQKLVDTLLCCDLVALSFRKPAEPIILVSNDDDMIPALILGAKLGGAVYKVQNATRLTTAYDPLCQQSGVTFLSI
jgi:hypothetical protein